jgi:tetratricopeptide (TPR) repeat protein
MSNLAVVLIDKRQYDEAEKLLHKTLAIDRRVLGPENPETMRAMVNLSWDLYREGRYSAAEELQHETLDIQSRVFRPENLDILNSLGNMGLILSHENRYIEAEKFFREALGTAANAEGQIGLPQAWYQFACGAAVAGHRDDAFQYLRQAIDHGYSDVTTMTSDDDLKSLYNEERFRVLVEETRQRAASAGQKH